CTPNGDGLAALLRIHGRPRLVRIEALHLGRLLRRFRSEIRLVDLPILIDDERHDAGIAVLCRIRDDGESADRPSLYDIVERAGFGALSLTLQHPVVVAVEGRRLVALLVALAGRMRHEHAEWTRRLPRLLRDRKAR